MKTLPRIKILPPSLRTFLMLVMVLVGDRADAQLSFELRPIEYSKTKSNDPVSILRQRVDSGEVTLHKDPKYGYLTSLLSELEIPVSSQTLVFSKTSLQRHLISPANPRAIYFNDETYVAWIPGGETIEIASTDAMLGSVFHTVDQAQQGKRTQISRKTQRCLFCHASSDTRRVPGLMMQSVFTNRDGARAFPSDSIWPHSHGPLESRWAGWFVSGIHGEQEHLGNLMISSSDTVKIGDSRGNGNVVDLSKWFDVTKYLSPHSDLVALLVLQHQVSIHNLLTESNNIARITIHQARLEDPKHEAEAFALTDEDKFVLEKIAERLVDGLLMVGQIEFKEPVSGTSKFTEEFSMRGPHGQNGRTLRELDLQRTIFRYPCSYLIYSDSFDALPQPLLDSVCRRLNDVLESKDSSEKYNHLSMKTRGDILEILRETKPDFFLQE